MTKKISRSVIKEAIQMIDAEFDQMCRELERPSLMDCCLIAATYKAVRFSNAIILLSEEGLTDEALPILRSLLEHAINMRWITNKNSEERLKEYLKDLSETNFGKKWTKLDLEKRMSDIGFNNRDYFDFCVKVTYSYAHVNASSLNWYEVFDNPEFSKKRWPKEALYVVTAQMLGHIMKALNSHFKEHFGKYNDIWEAIEVDKDVRKKFEEIKKQFEK